jgi:hypothetical protein
MPVALGGEGIGIVDLFVFACMLAIVVVLWTLLQARGPIGSVPIIGATGVSLIDAIRVQVTNLALSLENFLTWQQGQITDLWNRAVTNLINPYFGALSQLYTSLALGVRELATRAVPQLQADVTALQRAQATAILPALAIDASQIAALLKFEDRMVRVTLPAMAAEAARTAQEAANLRALLAGLTAEVQAVAALVARLAPFLPELQGLAAFEASAAGGVAALERDIANQRGRITGAEQELAKLVALSGVTVLGAVAIANLVRVARDPCRICDGLDLATVEARLTALEMFGET